MTAGLPAVCLCVCVCKTEMCFPSRWPSRKLIASLETLSSGNTIRNVRLTALVSCIIAEDSNNQHQNLILFCIIIYCVTSYSIRHSGNVSKVKLPSTDTAVTVSTVWSIPLCSISSCAVRSKASIWKKWAPHSLPERCWQQSLKLKITAGEKKNKNQQAQDNQNPQPYASSLPCM